MVHAHGRGMQKAMNIPIFYKVYVSMDKKFELSNYLTSSIVIHKVVQMKAITWYLLLTTKFHSNKSLFTKLKFCWQI